MIKLDCPPDIFNLSVTAMPCHLPLAGEELAPFPVSGGEMTNGIIGLNHGHNISWPYGMHCHWTVAQAFVACSIARWGNSQNYQAGLWKLSVNFFSVCKSYKNNGVIFNNNANAIFATTYPVRRFVTCYFFRLGIFLMDCASETFCMHSRIAFAKCLSFNFRKSWANDFSIS